ncbi:HNH endonuclease [uncultured Azohydromonas sp.]|jgi:Restriction endonuclease|uniref:HNH endonuclease n=1 Tax=uncultured Azohydromonas sp. TaxID=487342 RepID=UPI00262543FD|nr:HNH endonuclease [uncultured Azohydromonas sp.]
MPKAAPRSCVTCGTLVRDGTARCDAHKVRAGTFADRRRGTRQQRGYGADWEKRRLRILERDKGLCRCDECKRLNRLRVATEVDHRINKATWLARFGTLEGVDEDDNLQAINVDCHKAKTATENRPQLRSVAPR